MNIFFYFSNSKTAKIADLQAQNVSQRDAFWACRCWLLWPPWNKHENIVTLSILKVAHPWCTQLCYRQHDLVFYCQWHCVTLKHSEEQVQSSDQTKMLLRHTQPFIPTGSSYTWWGPSRLNIINLILVAGAQFSTHKCDMRVLPFFLVTWWFHKIIEVKTAQSTPPK